MKNTCLKKQLTEISCLVTLKHPTGKSRGELLRPSPRPPLPPRDPPPAASPPRRPAPPPGSAAGAFFFAFGWNATKTRERLLLKVSKNISTKLQDQMLHGFAKIRKKITALAECLQNALNVFKSSRCSMRDVLWIQPVLTNQVFSNRLCRWWESEVAYHSLRESLYSYRSVPTRRPLGGVVFLFLQTRDFLGYRLRKNREHPSVCSRENLKI